MPQDNIRSQAPGQTSTHPPPARAVRLVTMLAIGLVLTWLLSYWVRQAEIIALSCQITEAVPAIPGLAALFLLIVLNPFLRRFPLVRELSTGEIFVVYLFVTIATTMHGCGIVRFVISCITVPYYFSSSAAPLSELTTYIPGWLSPSDPVVHLWLYESSPFGRVPWDAWLVPVAAWTGFLLLLGGTILSFMLLFAERWIEHERLVFPLVRLPVEMLGEKSGVSFFRNPMTWIGVGAATLLNAIDMIHAVFFGGSGGGIRINIGKQLTQYPWRALQPIVGHIRPALIGLGYLVSTELSFSIWFFYLFHKLQALGLSAAGYRLSGIPFAQEQGIGAYVLLGLLLLWGGRSAVRQGYQALLTVWEGGSQDSSAHRWPLLAGLLGIFALMIFLVSAGMAPWLAGLYLAILLLVAIVYGRVRAETGVPLLWAFPYGQQQKVIWNFLGQARIVGSGAGLASPTIFALMIVLSRGYFPTVSGYQIEGLRLGKQSGVNWRQIAVTVMLAIGFGVATGFIFHLQPYYQEGGIGLRGGIWGEGIARQQYGQVLQAAEQPMPPDVPRIIATCFGVVMAIVLAAARSRWLAFPLHPIGYVVTCSYGNLVWAPFLFVWIAKTLILRYGGSKLYLQMLPAFLGFALGHFVVAGLIWGALGAALGGAFLRWGIWFG